MQTRCASIRCLLIAGVAIAVASASAAARAEEPTEPAPELPAQLPAAIPALKLTPPPALLLAQASPPAGKSKAPPPSAAPPPPAAPPPGSPAPLASAAPPASGGLPPPVAPPSAAPPPGDAAPSAGLPPPSGTAAPPPGGARPGGPYPYAPYPYTYSGIPLAPPTIPYFEDRPIPSNYRLEERVNRPLIATGLSLFALAYGISLGVSTIILSVGERGSEAFAPLLIPVVGPFITMGTLDEDITATMTLNGVTQTAGLLLVVVGAFATDKVLVRIEPPVASAAPEILVGPGSTTLRWRF